jgi:hypothetical protein
MIRAGPAAVDGRSNRDARSDDGCTVVTVNTGSHAVSGTRPQRDQPHTSTFSCVNGRRQGRQRRRGRRPAFTVATGIDRCTFHEHPRPARSRWSTSRPDHDGRVGNLLVDGTIKKTDAANNGSTPSDGEHRQPSVEDAGTNTLSATTPTYSYLNKTTVAASGTSCLVRGRVGQRSSAPSNYPKTGTMRRQDLDRALIPVCSTVVAARSRGA